MAAADPPPEPQEPDRLWLWNQPLDMVFDLIGAAIAAWVVNGLMAGGGLDRLAFTGLIAGCFGVGVVFRFLDLRRRRALARRQREHQILQFAQQHGGAVTPAQVAATLPHFGLDEARTWLDRLAKDRLCELDSDAAGNLVYRFPFGVVADDDAHWQQLEAAQGRAAGEVGQGGQLDVDA